MERYIDMHCHILPGVDDGAVNMEEMQRMIRIAHDENICCIIATPHYHPRRGHEHPDVLKQKLAMVREASQKIDRKLRIYLGSEIYYTQDIPEKLLQGEVLTMNRRMYVMVEFSPMDQFQYIKQGLQQLQSAGYEVILAHAERYLCLVDNLENAEHLCNMGIHMQVNADSILGERGKGAKQLIKELMDKDLVFGVGSDAHSSGSRAPRMKRAAEYVKKKYGKEYMEKIFFTNPSVLVKKQEGEEEESGADR